MSHVTKMDVTFNKAALIKVAKELGLEVREKATYQWYGRHVGDYPLPQGFKPEDLGKCEFALGIPGDPTAYEIGMARCKDGSASYEALFDFWGPQGRKLEKIIGKDGALLKTAYGMEQAKQAALKAGHTYTVSKLPNGKTRLVISTKGGK